MTGLLCSLSLKSTCFIWIIHRVARARTQRDVQLSNEETAESGCERHCFLFSSLQVVSGRLVKKKKVGLPTPFSLEPQSRGSLSSRLFLAPLGCVFAVFFVFCFARVNKTCQSPPTPWGAHCSGDYKRQQMPKESGGFGCHRIQGSPTLVEFCHGRACCAWSIRGPFEMRHPCLWALLVSVPACSLKGKFFWSNKPL